VIDGIEEFKVQTATFSAEFGQAAGGVVNVTMKSGTNHLHGSLFEFLRNSKLDATPYFQPAGGRAQFIQNQFGATLGGPIIKNRTFFLWKLAEFARRQRRAVDRFSPHCLGASGCLSIATQRPGHGSGLPEQHYPAQPLGSGCGEAICVVSAAESARDREQLFLQPQRDR